MWNGGIGTYVKASSETNADVGDRTNDGVRVNGADLRCRIVGEGGNLGFTQLGRVEYAISGGLVFTDAIDNSAGVDCSDHEVNIKILLDRVVAAGELTGKQRNELLESMTDEVGELVLANNKAQTLALTIARRQALPMVNVHARYIDVLESEGWMDRGLEFLPTDKQIAERQAAGHGLQAPEFAVLIAYTKNANVAEVTRSDLPDAALLAKDLVDYFPSALRERYAAEIADHPLRREIVATQLVNEMVNLSGISFDHRMTEDTGASVVDVTRAWVVARDVYDFAALWEEIDALTGQIPLETQLDLFLDCRKMAERGALWLLRHRRPPIAMSAAVAQFQPGIAELSRALEPALQGRMADVVRSGEASRLTLGVPEDLAERAGVWPLLHTGFDLVEVAVGARPRRGRRGARAVGDLRPPRPRLAVGRHRLAAAVGPLADPGPLGAARRPADGARRADDDRDRERRRLRRRVAAGQRALGGARHLDVHRDPPRRVLRPHDAVGGPAPAAQPRPHVGDR